MSDNNSRILFITPYGGHTGSEIALINIINYIQRKYNVDIYFVSLYDGTYVENLDNSITIYKFSTFLKRNRILSYLYKYLFPSRTTPSQRFFRSIYKAIKPDLVVLNTIMLFDILEISKEMKLPVVQYVHELEDILTYLDNEQTDRLIQYPSLFITNSNRTKEVYENLGRNDIYVVNPGINLNAIEITRDKEEVRLSLKIPIEAEVWCMSGTLDANKNPLLFIDIARRYIMQKANSYFLWIGGKLDSDLGREVLSMIEEYQISNNVLFVGQQFNEYYNYLNCIDGFILTSKKESFSIVTLESLFLGKYVLANDCGGVQEILLDKDLGKIVKNKEVKSFIDAMNSCECKESNEAKRDYRKMHALKYDISNTAEKFYKLIKEV